MRHVLVARPSLDLMMAFAKAEDLVQRPADLTVKRAVETYIAARKR